VVKPREMEMAKMRIVPEEGGLVYKTMRWGLVPFLAKDEKIGNGQLSQAGSAAARARVFGLGGRRVGGSPLSRGQGS
jgi:hypothetical protein